jgi:CHAT domain-containing protein
VKLGIILLQIGLAVAAPILLLGCRRGGEGSSSRVDADHRELVEAFSGRSPFEPRLAGFDAYAPCRSSAGTLKSRCRDGVPVSGPPQHGTQERPRVRRGVSRDGAASYLSGKWRLLTDFEGAQAATEAIEKSLDESPPSAERLNDLGAAHYIQALDAQEPAAYVRALDCWERARELAPASPVVLFNLGLVLSRLGLLQRASDSFAAAAKAEPGSPWAEEATARRRALASTLLKNRGLEQRLSLDGFLAAPLDEVDRWVREKPQEVRLLIEEQLLSAWAAETANPARAGKLLAAGLRAANGLRDAFGDVLPATTMEVIEQAMRAGPTDSRLQKLRAGHRAFGEGLELLETDDLTAAASSFERAASLLHAAESPFWHWASFYVGVCDYYQGPPELALSRYAALEDRIARRSYPNLQSRIDWMQGLSLMVQGRFASSVEKYEQANRRFLASGEKGHAAYLDALIAKDLRLMGEAEASWKPLLRAVSVRHLVHPAERQITILRHAAESSQALGAYHAALVFFAEQVAVATRSGRAFDRCDSLLRRSRAAAQAGELERAAADLESAAAVLPAIEPDLRARARADVASVRGELRLASSPASVMEDLLSSRAHYQATQNRVETLRADRLLAAAAQAAGNLESAARFLEEGILLSEDQRSALPQADQRAAYFAQAHSLIDAMIDLQLRARHDSASAFGYAERGRNRSLRDLIFGKALAPPLAPRERTSLESVTQALPAGTSLFEYAVLEDRLVVWRLRRDDSALAELPIDRRHLSTLAARFRSLILRRAARDEIVSAARELGSWVLPARLGPLAAGETLILVPAGPLVGLPFSALVSPTASHYLIADHPLVIAPSAALFIATEERLRGLAAEVPQRALVVADPDFDAARHPGLGRLPEAQREAEEVAALYPQPTILSGALPTLETVLARLQDAEIFAFAGHSFPPGPSGIADAGLLLAPSAGEGDLLSPALVAGLTLPNLRLVVLSSCSSALGTYRASDESASLASAFLAAGAPAAVASLWDVDDTATRAFTLALHRELRNGVSPALALQGAARKLLQSGDPQLSHPSIWAAFELLGSSGQPGRR